MFSQEMYYLMFENEEMWFITRKGFATLISDASLLDS